MGVVALLAAIILGYQLVAYRQRARAVTVTNRPRSSY